jgi:hypothetical protein
VRGNGVIRCYNTTIEIFLPVARFAGHVAASAVGFIALGVVALIPVYFVKLLIWVGGPTQLIELFSRVEIAVLLWAFVFLVEEVRACRKVLGW